MADEECGSQFPDHYKVMLDKLNEQRQLDQFTDITLIVDGHQFRAHKAVLAACSQFFHKFFQDFTQEPLVEIEGVSNSAFRQLMEFTYTATLVVSGPEEVNDVWKAAEYLQMQEAIKALNNRMGDGTLFQLSQALAAGNSKAKKRKISETLPSVEGEQVEIEVEIGEGTIEVEETEVVDAARNTLAVSDDSALALLADITSKYQQGGLTLHVLKKEGLEEEMVYQEETVTPLKTLESLEMVEVQISQLDNMFRCNKCDRSFRLYYHLKQHMRAHMAALDKPHACCHCGKAYTREGALKQHLNTLHYEAEELSRSQSQKKKTHVCEYCDKQFDHFGHFKEHLRKHTGEKPFACPDCHERFARNSTLKCHMAACQNGAGAKKGRKKLYECQVCSSVFNSWELFKDHLTTHTGEKPNHCTMCDLWFTQPDDLRRHLRRHLSDLHGVTDDKLITQELVIATAAVATQEEGAGEEKGGKRETLLLEDGRSVEHVTVEPVGVVALAETAMLVDGEVTEMCEEDIERLKEAGVEIRVVQVSAEGQVNSEIQVEGSEVEVEEDSQPAIAV
ncbi:zinc finger protein 131 [Salmo salar]|uniref:Zinc finger protein 131-like n=1 Tax=Salmo salar TaxID=8030 RepID=A0A1S3NQ24_SALSA|nr:zinc finger protein 131 [Salmo salar]XP_014017344.1 zinc finger protein 131 [Salmo salar]XP_014017345.1 zinc finger protein 131 [Salmo salar]|eukprot:XP_014017343.1 PREDICTED: zinc finger protein 131-like [Salmo salar]